MDNSTSTYSRKRRSISECSLNTSTPKPKGSNVESVGNATSKSSEKRARLERENDHKSIKFESKRKSTLQLKKMYDSDRSDLVHDATLRRSQRERRFIYANFTPSEIQKTIHNKHTINILGNSSEEEELEPYEKLLSPITKKSKSVSPNSHRYSTRSSVNSQLSVVRQHKRTSIEKDRNARTNQTNEQEIDVKEEEEEETSEANNDQEEEEEEEEGEEEEEEEGEEEEEEEDEGEEESSYYNLRKRRPVVYQYQPVIQVVDKNSHKKAEKHHKSALMHYRSAAYKPRKVHSSSKNNFHRKAHQDSTTSSSGEDSDEERFKRRKKRSMKRSRRECLPMNFTADDAQTGPFRDRAHVGTSLADISPMTIDRNITFDNVGGLREHITALKEMIVFPLMYPEVFDKFKINPPRGVLFHGPPGCGKTLVARALANECSRENRKIAFFMRKGADCLSKWVGESERQLRLLFDQAYQMRPSILFFDEIDGLAPVRSTRQDQIHSSIVSTLLALMDGLDSRGEVVVIGATNRIDSIDPALRRPGRFDREFVFPLPTRHDRSTILQIHTKSWSPPLQHTFLDELAEMTVGYCGADLKSLCTEAAMHSLRRQYPQIYESSDKLVIDVSKLTVTGRDFYLAYKDIVPTGQRSNSSVSKPLCDVVFPLIGFQFEALLEHLVFVFPQSWKCVRKGFNDLHRRIEEEKRKRNEISKLTGNNSVPLPQPIVTNTASVERAGNNRHQSIHRHQFPLSSNKIDGVFFELKDSLSSMDEEGQSIMTSKIKTHPHMLPNMHRPRLLITGMPGMGQCDHLSLALLHTCEDISIKLLDTSMLLGSVSQTPEEVCIQVFREARRVIPCIVYIPRIAALWDVMSVSFKATFRSILDSLPYDLPLMLLASTDCEPNCLSDDLMNIFPVSLDNCFMAVAPSSDDRRSFFYEVLLKQPLVSPPSRPVTSIETVHEPLPLAPPPLPRQLTEIEANKIIKQREAVLRELRVFLRETTNRLLAERKFKEFTKPVSREEVPDYYDIITSPMDLSTVMRRIDEKKYCLPKKWLRDIDQITANALEYNPEHDADSRLLRHRALALQDLAHSIFDHELNEEFEKQCEDIEAAYIRIQNNSCSPSKQTAPIDITSDSVYFTPRGGSSDIGSSRLVDDRNYDIRRSLRKLGVQPDSYGIPYYGPSKQRTPKQMNEEEETEEVERGDNDKENGTSSDNNNNNDQEATLISANKAIGIVDPHTSKPNSISSKRPSLIDFPKDMMLCLSSVNSSRPLSTKSSISSTPICTPSPPPNKVIVDVFRLSELFDAVVHKTENKSVDTCLKIHSILNHLVFRHRMDWNKGKLLEELSIAIENYITKESSNSNRTPELWNNQPNFIE